jgi:O-methyltransferase involved in polyketide biosynthesis
MLNKIAISLGNVQKTMLLPLWGRAMETKKARPLLVDKAAAAIIDSIDYDFSTITQNMNELSQIAWIARSLMIDRIVRAFLQKHPQGTIVNIGCGLDTTFERIDNGRVRWYDLDLPDVIELRRKFIPEAERRTFITASFLDEQWLRQIEVEDGVLFISAGVFYYFEAGQIKTFFKSLADAFPGSEIVFDVSSPRGVRTANKMVIRSSGMDEKSFLKWGLASTGDIAAWDNRIKIVDELFYFKTLSGELSLKNKILGLVSDSLRIQYLVHARFAA